MIIENYSVPTYSAEGGSVKKLRAIFDNLCEWDSVEEVSSEKIKYTYGFITVEVRGNDSTYYADIKYGDTTLAVTQYRKWLNIKIVKTASSVGLLIYNATGNTSIPTAVENTSVQKIVLTKFLNVSTDSEEKGLIYAIGTGTTGEFNVKVVSEDTVISATEVPTKTLTNAAVTILQPAACTTFIGYCPHVYIPVYQTCASSNCKAELNGANYYIMGGSLYLLDD